MELAIIVLILTFMFTYTGAINQENLFKILNHIFIS